MWPGCSGRRHLTNPVAQVAPGEHGVHAGNGARRGELDGTDPGVGNAAAHEHGMEHPRHGDPVGEPGLTGEEPGIFDAQHAPAREATHEATWKHNSVHPS